MEWKRPNIGHMHIFECVAYVLNFNPKHSKLNVKGIKCLLLGYCEDTKAYKLMYLETKKIIKSQDDTFIKHKYGVHDALEMCPSRSNEERKVQMDKFLSMDSLPKDEEDLEEIPPMPKETRSPSPSFASSKDEEANAFKEQRYPTRKWRPLRE